MATEAQINANRINAKASTGPKTEDGKGKAARNNTKFGLFATNNCVQPHEKQDYDHFCDVLWSELAPLGGIEEVTAAEYVRNAWRLRRCASAEEFIGGWGNRIQTELDAKRGIDRPMADPVIFDQCLPTQTAIDRARAQAQSSMRRAKADLEKLQATRKSQPQPEIPAVEPLVNEEISPTLSDRSPTSPTLSDRSRIKATRPPVQQVEPNPQSDRSDLIRSESDQRYASTVDQSSESDLTRPESDSSREATGQTIRSQSDPVTANPVLKKAA